MATLNLNPAHLKVAPVKQMQFNLDVMLIPISVRNADLPVSWLQGGVRPEWGPEVDPECQLAYVTVASLHGVVQ